MNCAVHSDVDAVGYCRNCGKAMCSTCVRPVRDVLYCEDCQPLSLERYRRPARAHVPAAAPALPFSWDYSPDLAPSTTVNTTKR